MHNNHAALCLMIDPGMSTPAPARAVAAGVAVADGFTAGEAREGREWRTGRTYHLYATTLGLLQQLYERGYVIRELTIIEYGCAVIGQHFIQNALPRQTKARDVALQVRALLRDLGNPNISPVMGKKNVLGALDEHLNAAAWAAMLREYAPIREKREAWEAEKLILAGVHTRFLTQDAHGNHHYRILLGAPDNPEVDFTVRYGPHTRCGCRRFADFERFRVPFKCRHLYVVESFRKKTGTRADKGELSFA